MTSSSTDRFVRVREGISLVADCGTDMLRSVRLKVVDCSDERVLLVEGSSCCEASTWCSSYVGVRGGGVRAYLENSPSSIA
jgi:hypothetical protein